MSVDLDIVAPFVAQVMLDRPPVNALDRRAREELLATIEGIQERDDVRAVVLSAKGRVFCAGADIKEKDTLIGDGGNLLRANRLTRDVFFALVDSTKPVIAAVNGPAVGAGFVLAACCDMIFADETATFAMPEIDVGLGGGASFLRRVLPLSKVRRMVLTGERVPARELFRLGAIEECCPASTLVSAAIAVASEIATKSPAAVRAIRRSFLAVEEMPLRDGFRLEQEYTNALSISIDAAEARKAFIERRKAVF